MSPITETPNYKVSSVVLSRKNPFTISDIEVELDKRGNNMRKEVIKKVLDKLNDNGVVVQSGARYMLSIFNF